MASWIGFLAVEDAKLMDMVVAPGMIDILQNESQSLYKRQKILDLFLNELKTISQAF